MAYEFNHVTYLDIDHYNEETSFLDQTAIILDKGQFKTHWHSLTVGPYTLIDIKTSTSVLYEGQSTKDFYLFTFIKDKNKAAMINGAEVGGNSVFFLPPSHGYFSVCPADLSAFQLCIHRRHFQRIVSEEAVTFLNERSDCIRQGRTYIAGYPMFSLRMCRIIRLALMWYTSFSKTHVFDLQESITEEINQLFLSSDFESSRSIENTFQSRLAVVRRAQEYVESSDSIQITVQELAQQSFCSLRTLEYSFKEVLSISPRNYIKVKRLQKIKAILGKQQPLSVGVVLREFGVVNMGRFSQDYFRFFGEYPKDTLKRSKSSLF